MKSVEMTKLKQEPKIDSKLEIIKDCIVCNRDIRNQSYVLITDQFKAHIKCYDHVQIVKNYLKNPDCQACYKAAMKILL